MNEAIPKKPIGSSPKWFFFRRVWDFLFGGKFPITGFNGIIVKWTEGKYRIGLASEPRAGTSGGSPPNSGMVYRGEWDEEETYDAQDLVKITGVGMFICITDATPVGTDPTTSAPYWDKFINEWPGTWSF